MGMGMSVWLGVIEGGLEAWCVCEVCGARRE
jgi:hypothetical protein